jgi:hypothetical protein
MADDSVDLLLLAGLGAGAYWYLTNPDAPARVAAVLGDLSTWVQGVAPAVAAPAPAPAVAPASAAWVPAPSSDVGTLALTPSPSSAPTATADVTPFVSPASAVVSSAPTPAAQAAPSVSPDAAQVPRFALSAEAQVKLGLSATKEMTRWFLTPSDITMDLSPETASAWADYKAGEWADYSTWVEEQTPAVDVGDLSVIDNDAVLTGMETGEGLTGEAGAALEEGLVEAVPMPGETMSVLAPALQAFGVAAALTDMGFVIAGKLPDAEKAVVAALDAVMIAALFIPVYGWIVAAVVGILRGIVGMFGSSLFGSPALSHAQREALEVQRTAKEGLNPWMHEVAGALTPRELVDVLIRWGTGYCGGTSPVAVMTFLWTGAPTYTGAPERVYIGTSGCYINQGQRYRDWPNAAAMDRDALAIALVQYGATDALLSIQAGVAQHFKDDMDALGLTLLQKRLTVWAELAAHGVSLDDFDALALEQRMTAQWDAVAVYFGRASWHELVGWDVQDRWTRYLVTMRDGTLNDFAHTQGYRNWLAMRDAVMETYVARMPPAPAPVWVAPPDYSIPAPGDQVATAP